MTLDLTIDELRLLIAMADIAACVLMDRPVSEGAVSLPEEAHEGLSGKLAACIPGLASVAGHA